MSQDRFRLGYRPSLDGVRGIAILLVLFYHFGSPLVSGFVGVDVFFVLSGFLITVLLGEELERSGRLDFPAFYRRRILRLLPALVAVIVVLVGITFLVRSPHRHQALREAWMALFYSLNWFKAYGGVAENNYLGHTWSLCVEEQFYLLWPLILAAMLRCGMTRGQAAILTGAGLLASATMRAVHWMMYADWARVYCGLDSRADGLLTGCLLGLFLLDHPPPASRPRWLGAAGGLGLLTVLALSALPFSADFYFLGGIPLVNLSMAALLGALLVGPPDSLLHRLLELRALVWVGRISYGLYLWHALAPHLLMKLRWNDRPWSMPANVALSFVLATLSYYGLEVYFLKRKRRSSGGVPLSPEAPS